MNGYEEYDFQWLMVVLMVIQPSDANRCCFSRRYNEHVSKDDGFTP
jgi:hypothetical protein